METICTVQHRMSKQKYWFEILRPALTAEMNLCHVTSWQFIGNVLSDNLFFLNLSSHLNNIIYLSVCSVWLLCLVCEGLKEFMQWGYGCILTLCWRWILSLSWTTKALSAVSMTAPLTSDPLREENSSDWTHIQKSNDNSSELMVHYGFSSEILFRISKHKKNKHNSHFT